MSEPTQVDPGIQSKNDLTIRFEGGSLYVEDRDRKGGGNVRSRSGQEISWSNATELNCVLTFSEFLADDEPGHGDGHWPFKDEPEPGPYTQVIGRGLSWKGKLKRGCEAFIKYDVVLMNGNTVVAKLDPIIIVERRS